MSWDVLLFRPGVEADKGVATCESYRDARIKARKLNRKLSRVEGKPLKAPFAFYYVQRSKGGRNFNLPDVGVVEATQRLTPQQRQKIRERQRLAERAAAVKARKGAGV